MWHFLLQDLIWQVMKTLTLSTKSLLACLSGDGEWMKPASGGAT